jgi:hypothetical protein
MMMEAASTCATSVNFYQTTRRYNPGDSNLNIFSDCISVDCVKNALRCPDLRKSTNSLSYNCETFGLTRCVHVQTKLQLFDAQKKQVTWIGGGQTYVAAASRGDTAV